MNYLAQSVARVGQVVAASLVAGAVAFASLALAEPQLGSPSPTLAATMPPPAWEAARVTRLVDGDTYEVLTGGVLVRVRLLGVDAPERDQPFGQAAADSAARLLLGQLVRLRRQGTDLYRRTLASLTLPRDMSRPALAVDSLLVRRGWAWAYDPTHAQAARAPQQTAAQQAGLGLWKCGVAGPVPPKLWRGFTTTTKRRYRGSCTW